MKLIFLDIDGTLTLPGHNVPPESALKAIKKTQTKGNKVFLCSGRNYIMLSPLLQYGFDGVIASSGGYVECEGSVIYDRPMTKEESGRALEILDKNGIFYTVESFDGSYTHEGFKEFLRKNANSGSNSELLRWREQIESSLNILPLSQYDGQPLYKIVVMSDSPARVEEPKNVLTAGYNFVLQAKDQFGFVNGEIISDEYDKGQAVERVCTHYGIDISDTFAFGDSMNDREMLEVAGTSICMENGSEEMKAIVDDVCPAVDDDGIYKAFEKYNLI